MRKLLSTRWNIVVVACSLLCRSTCCRCWHMCKNHALRLHSSLTPQANCTNKVVLRCLQPEAANLLKSLSKCTSSKVLHQSVSILYTLSIMYILSGKSAGDRDRPKLVWVDITAILDFLIFARFLNATLNMNF